MMYIRTSSRPKDRRLRMIATIGGVIILLVVILQLFVPHFLPSIFTTLARPFWRMEFSFSGGSMNSPEMLLAENEALKIRIQELSVADANIDSLRAQHSQLLTALGRSDLNITLISNNPIIAPSSTSATTSSTTKGDLNSFVTSLTKNANRMLAAILVRPPFALYDEYIIDVGADKGIKAGSKVYAPGNILIGTTSDVLGQTSKVTLFSSPGEKYSVFIGSNHVPATAIGRGGGQYEAQVPQATTIKEGDIVTDSTLADGVFGTVTKIINNPADPFITVLFAPPVNIYQLRWVFISK